MNWIKCSDRLPDLEKIVLVYSKRDYESDDGENEIIPLIFVGSLSRHYSKNEKWLMEVHTVFDDYYKTQQPESYVVTHWSPIELPEGLE